MKRAIVETIAPATRLEPLGGRRYRALVGRADVATRNGRIYTQAEWTRQIDRANRELIPAGRLQGAVDHADDRGGGNLRDNAILWHKLEMDTGGYVWGELSIVEDHSRGRDLLALIRAGAAIGFSTFGEASTRPATEAERRQYGVAVGEPAWVVVDWEVQKVDATDRPAVDGAFLVRESVDAELDDGLLIAPDEAGDASKLDNLVDALRRAGVGAVLESSLALLPPQYDAPLRRAFEQEMASSTFDVAAAEAFIDKKCREYSDVLASLSR
jgi:hypothetical protein